MLRIVPQTSGRSTHVDAAQLDSSPCVAVVGIIVDRFQLNMGAPRVLPPMTWIHDDSQLVHH